VEGLFQFVKKVAELVVALPRVISQLVGLLAGQLAYSELLKT